MMLSFSPARQPMRTMARRGRPNQVQARGRFLHHNRLQLRHGGSTQMSITQEASAEPVQMPRSDNAAVDNNYSTLDQRQHHSHHSLRGNLRGGRSGRGRGRGGIRSRGGSSQYSGQALSSHNTGPLLSNDVAHLAAPTIVNLANDSVSPRRYPMRRSRNSMSNVNGSSENVLEENTQVRHDVGSSGFNFIRGNFQAASSERDMSPQKMPLLPTPDMGNANKAAGFLGQVLPLHGYSVQQPIEPSQRRQGRRSLRNRPRRNVANEQLTLSTQAEPQSTQQTAVNGTNSGSVRAGRHVRYRKPHPHTKHARSHKIRKPYHELTWEEKKKIAAAEERKAELRQRQYEQSGKRKSAPHNTTQYIIDQSEADALEPPKKVVKNLFGARGSVSGVNDANSPQEASLVEGASDDSDDFDKSLEREFDEQYDKVLQLRLGRMSKAELVEHCTTLEGEREYLVGKLARLEIDFQGVRAENERMKKTQLEQQMGSIITRSGGVCNAFALPAAPQQLINIIKSVPPAQQHNSIDRQSSLHGSDDARSSSEQSSSTIVLLVNGNAAAPVRAAANELDLQDAGVFVQPSLHRMQTRNAQARSEQQQQQQHVDTHGPSSSGGSSTAGGKSGGTGGSAGDNV